MKNRTNLVRKNSAAVASLVGPSPTRDTPRPRVSLPARLTRARSQTLRSCHHPPLPIAIHLGPATPRYYLARALSYTRPPLPRHLARLTVALHHSQSDWRRRRTAAPDRRRWRVDAASSGLRVEAVAALLSNFFKSPPPGGRRVCGSTSPTDGRHRRTAAFDAIAAQPRSTPHPSGVSESTPSPDQHQIWQRQDAPRRHSSSVLFRSSTGDQHLQRAIRSQVWFPWPFSPSLVSFLIQSGNWCEYGTLDRGWVLPSVFVLVLQFSRTRRCHLFVQIY
jgi:hypothetical protein